MRCFHINSRRKREIITKTRETLQTLSQNGKVLSKIVFIFSLIGAIG